MPDSFHDYNILQKIPKQVELRLVVLWGGGLRAQWREIRTGDKVGNLPTRQGVQCCPDTNSVQTGFADVFVGVDVLIFSFKLSVRKKYPVPFRFKNVGSIINICNSSLSGV